ncbi:response regulator [Solihabitans fulvus]|uniref:Response regulator n=1 Tax=Solihabitans fulvus TaxID=1892852 RepID=A0A5B2WN67_9PSEU|nr:FAD-dependent oxidoreductase [Solihabitans fulvus]KAA2252414.1 response regulator [Solihabitans fulvus]
MTTDTTTTADDDRRPVMLAVDDDPQVLRAVRRDLRRSYAGQYRVVTVSSAAEALAVLDELAARGEEPALLLSDQRMPETTGVEFLRRSLTLFPEARRVLLTAYADTDAAISAINDARLDHYLMKPWDPPEERFYPVLDDLLADWQAARASQWQGIRVIGLRFNAATHDIRNFLTRQLIPFRFTDAGANPDAADGLALPVVEFPDGSRLAAPTTAQLSEQLGLATAAERKAYDLVIVGAGPSGLAAAVYGASEGLSTVAVDREAPGGQAGTSSRIENYLGFPAGLSGGDLARRATAQAKRLGAEILSPQEITSLRVEDSVKVITLSDGTEITAQALILATGVSYNRLDVPGADGLAGAGVYYGAAVTEAISCSGLTVYVVGGANSAGQGAMYFSKYAARVVMLIRGDSLEKGMSQYLVEQIRSTPNIEVRLRTKVVRLEGEGRLERLVLDRDGTEQVAEADAVFTFIGAAPRTSWLPKEILRDPHGFVITGTELSDDQLAESGWSLSRLPFLLETSVPGVFAVGDVRSGAMRRVASAVGEGAMAVAFTHQYLAGS